jgi:2-iminobutanoate/2-iminopropanoate deaminase
MERTQVNPWTWQDRLGFSQAWRVDGARSVVFASGQGPLSPEGQVVGEGDFEAQARQTLENLRTVLEAAGASLEAIVKLTVYLTDIANLREWGRIKAGFMPGPQPASTALEVRALALPAMLIEVEAIAVVS